MIIKKPYVFLIKHFRKIHIFLLIASILIFVHHLPISSFIREFVSLGVYDQMNDPVTNHIHSYIFLLLFVVSAINISLIFLLKYKEKPWKVYLFPTITYILMALTYFLIINYFNGFDGNIERTQVSLYRDLIRTFNIIQIPVMIIYLIRCLGVDLKRFNFQLDQEYLELNEDDKLEIEININFDKTSVKRVSKRLLRYFNYFVQEHKKLVIAVISILVVYLGYKVYQVQFVENKTYSQNDDYYANGYVINILNSYYTDKDKAGKKKENAFVIIELKMTNKDAPRIINIDNFHLYNGVKNFAQMSNNYAPDFEDLGKVYDQKETIKRDETKQFILIFRVDKELNKNRFVLFYQEYNGNNPFLRKIKIKTKDLSVIKDNGTFKLGQEMEAPGLEDPNEKELLAPASYEFSNNVNIVVQDGETSKTRTENIKSKSGYTIMKIFYMTEEYVAKDIIDFSSKYGKINYIDSNNKKISIPMENATNYTSLGQYIYVEVPEEIKKSNSIELEYTIRNNKYIYKLK